MEIENQIPEHNKNLASKKKTISIQRLILLFNCTLLAVGNTAGPLVMRLYFYHGGKRVWLSCMLETGGWPFMLIPLTVSYIYRKRTAKKTVKVFYMTPFLFASAAGLGILTGFDDFMYASGVARLPTSTSVLIISTQLAFTAGFAFLIVKQKFTPFSINAVALLTVGAVVLALHTSSDRPKGESGGEYLIGFLMTLGASALYGFVLPMVELTYKKSKRKMTYTLVVEMQMVISFFATAVCIIGMLINKDFQAIPKEARAYALGEGMYYVVLVLCALMWQLFFLGAVGVIFSASSLLSGVIIAVGMPLTESLAVAFFGEKFTAEKGISLALSLWGFVSYFYGEIQDNKKAKETTQSETNNSLIEE